MCSRRPPPASPRASRKFASSELRDSESGGSDISDKSSLLAGGENAERRIGTPSSTSSRGKTCPPNKKPAATLSTPATSAASPSQTAGRRTTPKSPSNSLANSIAEEVPEAQPLPVNNQDVDAQVNTPAASQQSDQSNMVLVAVNDDDDNLEKMNVQNGLSPDQRQENGNPPASIVPSTADETESSSSTSTGPQDNNMAKMVVNRVKGKSTRGDSTDALLSGEDDKSPNDENNPSSMMTE